MRAERNHLAGMAAEEIVARRYAGAGGQVIRRRWRGRAGEVDIIARQGDMLVFVEVKASASHRAAALRLSHRQLQRISRAAEEFLGGQPLGLLTAMRIDLALVDGRGAVEVIENVSMAA